MTTIQRSSMQRPNSQASFANRGSLPTGPIVQKWNEAVQTRDRRQSNYTPATKAQAQAKSTVTATPTPTPLARSFAAALKSQNTPSPSPTTSKSRPQPKPTLERKQTLGRDAIRPWSDIFSVERMEKDLDQIRKGRERQQPTRKGKKGSKGGKGGAFGNYTNEYSAYLLLEETGMLPKAYEVVAAVDIEAFRGEKSRGEKRGGEPGQSWSRE
ncbi:hypothetical protein K491DRAFT_721410 [Lophiostoma macrostomum CBS 122681]|uniref:Uncharacterized protein n=1 Tax=Lophiostoma macrostomum CBS 122681 TaxID=1314788 RepID=A0A6A6SPF5_9PLEO|nr:hypothetical protein K491DRAFT_721410 [Lophiostoma macrostomum CBS 122681]